MEESNHNSQFAIRNSQLEKFDAIRSFEPEELPAAYDRLLADPQFLKVVAFLFPGVPTEAISAKMHQQKTNLDFQKAFCYTFLKDLLAKSLDLQIVGIVVPAEGSDGASREAGIGYDGALIGYMIRESATRQIVKDQLADKTTDVFTGESFDNINSGGRSSLSFADMISVDQKKLASALGGNFNTSKISRAVNDAVKEMLESVSADTSSAYEQLGGAYGQLAGGMFNKYIEDHGVDGVAAYDSGDVPGMVSDYLDTEAAITIMNSLGESYGLSGEQVRFILEPILADLANNYLQSALDSGLSSAPVTGEQVDQIVLDYTSTSTVITTLSQYAAFFTEINF